jgi:uncharacterized protein (DUF2141 family)
VTTFADTIHIDIDNKRGKRMFLLIPLLFSQLFSGEINLEISGVDTSRKGELRVALFKSSEGFPEKTSFRGVTVPVENSERVTFSDIPDGTYSISFFHDENGDKELNKNFFGVPTEGYGFSNNLKPLFLTPTFEEANFKLVDKTDLKIEVNY